MKRVQTAPQTINKKWNAIYSKNLKKKALIFFQICFFFLGGGGAAIPTKPNLPNTYIGLIQGTDGKILVENSRTQVVRF